MKGVGNTAQWSDYPGLYFIATASHSNAINFSKIESNAWMVNFPFPYRLSESVTVVR